MAFQLSPGINVSEVDLTTVVPAVATTEGATVGVFRWGPTDERILVSSQVELASRFGKPYTNIANSSVSWTNHESFFTAANFLDYSDALYVTRVVSDSAVKAASNTTPVFEAKYEGELGNSIDVVWIGKNAFEDSEGLGTVTIQPSGQQGEILFQSTANNGIAQLTGLVTVGDILVVGTQELTINNIFDVTQSELDANTGLYDYSASLNFNEKFIAIDETTEEYLIRKAFSSSFDIEPIDTNHLIQMDRWDDLEEVLTHSEILEIEEDDDCVKFEFI